MKIQKYSDASCFVESWLRTADNTFHCRTVCCLMANLYSHVWQRMHGQRQGCTNSAMLVCRTTIVVENQSKALKCMKMFTNKNIYSRFYTKHDTISSPLISRSKCSLIKIWFYLFHSIIIIIIITWQRK